MSRSAKQTKKSARTAKAVKAERSPKKRSQPEKEDRFGAGPFLIAVLLIGAIALAVGFTMQRNSPIASENVAPNTMPETGGTPDADMPEQAPNQMPAGSGTSMAGVPTTSQTTGTSATQAPASNQATEPSSQPHTN